MKQTNYEKTQDIIYDNIEKEKIQIYKKFKNIKPQTYLYAKLYTTMQLVFFSSPGKHLAEGLIKDALEDAKGFVEFVEEKEIQNCKTREDKW